MIKKLLQNLWARDAKEFWLLSLVKKGESFFFYLLILFLPTQLGKHFWPDFSYVLGQRIDYLSPTIYVTDIFLLALFLIVLFQRKIRVHPFFSLFSLFLGITIFVSRFPADGWYMLLKFLEVSFFVWYLSMKGGNTMMGILLLVGVVTEVCLASGQMILQHSVGGIFYFLGERSFSALTPGIANASIGGQLFLRPYATFSHPNMFAGYIVVTSLVIYYLFQKKESVFFKNFFSPLFLLVGSVGVVMSLGRVAILIWLLGVLFFMKKSFKNFMKTLAACLVVGGIFLSIVSILFPEIILRFLPVSFGQSVTERVLLANSALVMLRMHPLLGVGLGNFLPSLPTVSANDNILQPVHNIFLLVVAELGFFGVTIFILFLWGILRKLFIRIAVSNGERKTKLSYLLLALIAILFSGMFDHYWLTIQQGQLLFGLVVALCLREGSSSA